MVLAPAAAVPAPAAAAAVAAAAAAEASPAFYLPEPSLVDLADARIVVGGFDLPVHSQLLSLQSGVLRELFRGERERGEHGGPAAEEVVLREPFSACTAPEVAWFLRLAYRLDESQADQDVRDMGSCLPAVLRLAHALDAPRLLQRVQRHIEGKSVTGDLAAVVQCIQLAEECQLDELYTKCVLRLAARLCTPSGGVEGGDGFSQAAALAGLGTGTLLLTLGTVAEAAKRTGANFRTYNPQNETLVVSQLPTEQQVAAAQRIDERRRCRVCGATFPSRTKLFEHLHAWGHEADTPSPAVLQTAAQLGRGG